MAQAAKPAGTVVLVVEDDPVLLLHSAATIHDAGFDVLEARNAAEAIAFLETRPDIGIVFTDIEMPGSMNGILLAHAVRSRWPPVHLIMASGRCAPLPADLPMGTRFFPKPYDPGNLLSVVRELARAPRPTPPV